MLEYVSGKASDQTFRLTESSDFCKATQVIVFAALYYAIIKIIPTSSNFYYEKKSPHPPTDRPTVGFKKYKCTASAWDFSGQTGAVRCL